MTTAPLPAPELLGFPPKFQDWYPDQLRAIDRAVLSKKRFIGLSLPTGAGKSLVGIAIAKLHAEVTRALYLTSTKGLQDQLGKDFRDVGLFDLRGQRNYPCRALDTGGELNRYRRGRGWVGCDEGPCHSAVFCSLAPSHEKPGQRPNCLYYGAAYDARHAELVATNYAMYLTSAEYSEGLGPFDLLILDEAHDADKHLEEFLTLEVTAEDAAYLSSRLLKTDDLTDWRDWARFHVKALASKLEVFLLVPPKDPEGAQEIRQIKRILGKLKRLAEIEPTDWVADWRGGSTIVFCPLRVSKYAEAHLFRGIKHIVLMSATMTPKTAQLLGIPKDELDFWECPSQFPVRRRPIISVNTVPYVRVDAKMSEGDKLLWVHRIDNLITPRRLLGRKGIIETVSYERMKYLQKYSAHNDMFIVHDARTTSDAIKHFKTTRGPKILVSPSVVTGFDFPGDECRYIIIAKVPQIDMRGAIMQARRQIDKEYAGYLAAQKLVQGCGRGMRHAQDWCEVFIVDDHFADWFLDAHKRHMPKWYLDAIEYTEVFPEPLQVGEP